MSQMRRWLEEEPPPHVRRLLELGQWERPSPALVAETVNRVRTAALDGPARPLFPAGRGEISRTIVKWTLVGALLIGAATALSPGFENQEPKRAESAQLEPHLGGLVELSHLVRHELERDKSAAGEAPAPSGAPASPSGAVLADRDVRPVSGVRSAVGRHRPAASGGGTTGGSAGRVCQPVVTEQIAMLEQVKSEVRSGQAAKALATLDRYDRFGAGRCFVLESLKYRMDASLQMGDRAGARRIATAIKNQYPDTAQAREAESVLSN